MEDAADDGFREKYRSVLKEQERMEKQFNLQLDAMRKTLAHLSMAAHGLDERLDRSMSALKESFKLGPGGKIIENMNLVQQAAVEFDRERHAHGEQSAANIRKLVLQLAELKIDPVIKDSLQSFASGLQRRMDIQRNYPDILEELRKLQAMALDAASHPSGGFWQRLKPGKTLDTEDEESSELAAEETDLTPDGAADIETSESIGRFNPGSEDDYEVVAQRIAQTLENLVSRISPNDLVRHKIDIVRLRIQRGMDWYALAVTLEDIRDILLLRYLQNDKEFSDYLKRVNEQLHGISEALGLATEHDKALRKASEKLTSTVSDRVTQLRDDVKNSKNLDTLKGAVNGHLSTIQGALGEFQINSTVADKLAEQLQMLVSRVHEAEEESQKTKKMLEEERYRATHDTLTGLPNREAYNERAFHEFQRFKRYCRPLTMAVCDIDHFKSINDTYGHQAGDKILKLIAKLISTRLRKVDFVARYGGEEFVMLMPETPIHQALKVLDKVRMVIAKTPFKFKGSPVTITISFGLAGFTPEDTVESVFERADLSLYKAKRQGRNRCVISDEDDQVREPEG